MFVHYETEVSLPMAEVERELDAFRSHLVSLAPLAYLDGEELRAKVGPGGPNLAKQVRLEIWPSQIHRSGLIYPIRWSAVGAESLFPHLTADLIVSHLGLDRTKIVIDGTYQPPLGHLGRIVDRVLLRRVAEATVKGWMDTLADSLSNSRLVT
jgi:hypothetical protein